MNQEKPTVVYKYHAIDNHFYNLLKNGQLWFSHQGDLNDPFDCKYAFSDSLFASHMQKTGSSMVTDMRKLAPEFNNLTDEAFLKIIRPIVNSNEWKNGFYHMLFNDLGWNVCCFTTNPMNELMWAFYAQSSKGVCIEFDFSLEPKLHQTLLPVKYQDEFPEINSFDDLVPALLVKRKAWTHENEWRMLSNTQQHSFNKDCIKKIIFGYKVEKSTIEEIRQFMISNGYTEVKFQQVNMRIKGTTLKPMPELNLLKK